MHTNVAPRAKLGATIIAVLSAIACVAYPGAASPQPQTASSPSPSPSPSPKLLHLLVRLKHRDTLGVITVHAGAQEGYTIPISELQRLGATTVGDALRFVPGAVVQQYGPPGSLQTAALRGASASQTLVLMDGRPVNEGETGVADFTSLPLDDLQAITVTEGGLSTLYGSGAVGGVINLIRKADRWGHSASAYVQSGYQGALTRNVSVLEGTNAGGFGAWFNASQRNASNVFDYPAFGGIAPGTRTNNDLRSADANLTLRAASRRVYAALDLENNASDLGVPGSTEFGPNFISKLARQQRIANRSSATMDWFESVRNHTRVSAYVDGRRVHFFDPTPSFPFDTLTHMTTRGYSISHVLAFSPAHVVTMAYEGRSDRALFEGTFNSPPSLVASSASTDYFVKDIYQPREWLWIGAGLRTQRDQGIKATTLPSVELQWRFTGDVSGLRANYSRAFRAPNLDERYFPGFGNPKLEPEYAATFDVGIYENSGHQVTNTATLTYFGLDTNNLIVNQAIDTMGNFLPFNVGRARVRGFSAKEVREWGGDWDLMASYTNYFKASDLGLRPDLNGVVNYGNRLQLRPTATSTLEAWRTMIGGDSFGFDLRFVGQRYGDEENKHSLPPYAALGAFATKAVGKHLLVTARADNLTNQQVMDAYGFPTIGATLSIKLSSR